ncbi:MAG: glycosyltransferase family 2 protein [bacterium]|nr:glycosyltransferase family 2 protein [bacterium]
MNDLNLSVIVLSFNTKEITDECLKRLQSSVVSCQKKLRNKIEVIVVENASSDGSLEMVQQRHPWVKLIVSHENTGFSKGNNIGMKASQYPYILLLNSDSYVEEGTLETSLRYFESHPNCDALGCRQILPNGNIQVSAGFLPTPLNTILWISGLNIIPGVEKLVKPIHPRDKSFLNHEHQAEWVMGAFFMMTREVYEKTGGFDESIFMYGEEVELSKRINDLGFQIFYVPSITITHLDKASSQHLWEKPLLNEIKGLVRFFKQHYPQSYFLIKIVLALSLALRLVIFTLLRNTQRQKAYWQALTVI